MGIDMNTEVDISRYIESRDIHTLVKQLHNSSTKEIVGKVSVGELIFHNIQRIDFICVLIDWNEFRSPFSISTNELNSDSVFMHQTLVNTLDALASMLNKDGYMKVMTRHPNGCKWYFHYDKEEMSIKTNMEISRDFHFESIEYDYFIFDGYKPSTEIYTLCLPDIRSTIILDPSIANNGVIVMSDLGLEGMYISVIHIPISIKLHDSTGYIFMDGRFCIDKKYNFLSIYDEYYDDRSIHPETEFIFIIKYINQDEVSPG